MGRITLMVAMMVSAVFANINTANAKCIAIPGQGGVRHFPVFKRNGTKMMFLHDTEVRTMFVTNQGSTPLYKCSPKLRYDASKLKCKRTYVRKDYSDGVRASGWHIGCSALPGTKNHIGLDLKILTRENPIKIKVDIYRKFKYLMAIVAKIKKDGLSAAWKMRIEANERRSKDNARKHKDAAAHHRVEHERVTRASKDAQRAFDMAGRAETKVGKALKALKAKGNMRPTMEFGMGFFYTFAHQGIDITFERDQSDRRYPAWGIELFYTWWAFNKDYRENNLSFGPTLRLRWSRFVMTLENPAPDSDVLAHQYDVLADFNLRYKFGKHFFIGFYVGGGLGLASHSDQISDPNNMDGVKQNVFANFQFHGGAYLGVQVWRFTVSLQVSGTVAPKGLMHPDHINNEPATGTVGQGFMGLQAAFSLY